MEKRNELLIRAYLVAFFFVALTLVIFYRVIKVSVFEGDKWRAQGGKNVKMIPIQAHRGNIYSDDGTTLVTSLPFFDIRMDLKVVRQELFDQKVDSLSYLLATKIGGGKTKEEWRSHLVKAKLKNYRYFKIANDLSYDQLLDLKEFPIFRRGQNAGGLIVEKKTIREKPFKALASRTLGEIRENAPDVGLEAYFDEYLKGSVDSMLMKRVPGGNWIPVYDIHEIGHRQGDDLYTTLDVDIQDIVQSELLKSIQEHGALGGTAMVMDVKTGALKAVANYQWSNLRERYKESYNHAIGTLSEPGSTFKTATVLALFDDGYESPESLVDLQGGKKKFYSEWMYDSKPHGIRQTSLKNAFAISSNVGIAEFAMDNYERRDSGRLAFKAKLEQFRLDRKTGIEIAGEKTPMIKDPLDKSNPHQAWSGTTVPWMAHGYELELSPLQILAFYNAIANDGKYMKPFLSKAIYRDGEPLMQFKPKAAKKRIAGKKAIRYTQELLREVFVSGTAKKLNSKEISLAGKSGTAIGNYKDEDGEKRYNGSFAGYFPSEDPKYSMIVILYQPKEKYYGAQVAGPVFKSVAEKINALKIENYVDVESGKKPHSINSGQTGYAPDFKKILEHTGIEYKREAKTWTMLNPSEEEIKLDRMRIKRKEIPSVEGMGLRDALYVLENLGLKVESSGVGKVVNQSLLPGSAVNGQKIHLELR